ncbi:MAG TPA: hypothetical protein G4N94_06420 [Caldilineae bacterium]|nr:hypothetical protein [Caldilineae bacterium]
MRKRKWRNILQTIIVVVILAFWGQVLVKNWDQLANYPWRISWPSLLQSLVVLMVELFLVSTIWWRALTLVGKPIPWRRGTAIWWQAQIARYIPGGVWDVAGRLVLGRRAGVDKRRMSASVGLEMGLQVLSASLFLLVALLFGADASVRAYWPFILLIIVGSLLILTPPVFSALINWGLNILHRQPLILNITYGNLILLFLLRIIAHGALGLAFFLFARGLSSIPWSQAPLMISAYVGAWLIGYLAVFVPTGIGVREGALVLLLGPQFPFGLATASAIGFRVWIAVRDLLGALLGTAMARGISTSVERDLQE